MLEVNRKSEPKRLPQYSIAVLLVLMTICAIFLGWMADRQRLIRQIPVPTEQRSAMYPIANADPDLLAKELSVLFEHARVVRLPNTNEVVVTAHMKNLDKIQYTIGHLDREGTDLVEMVEADAKGDGTETVSSVERSKKATLKIPQPTGNGQK